MYYRFMNERMCRPRIDQSTEVFAFDMKQKLHGVGAAQANEGMKRNAQLISHLCWVVIFF
jgi:hypothetical protein